MEAVVRLVTEFFMISLCIASASIDQKEIRVDVVEDRGYMDTIIVRREKIGYTVHDEMDGKLVHSATILPKACPEDIYVYSDLKGKSETINLQQVIRELELPELRTKHQLRLESIDGVKIAVDRSKDVAFISHDKMNRTYVVH